MGFRRRKIYRRKRRNYRSSKKTVRTVKRVLFRKTETKYSDYTVSVQSVQSGSDQIAINPYGLTTGTSTGNRIGNKIYGTWVNFRCYLTANSQDNEIVRISFVRFRTNGITKGDYPSDPTQQWDKEKFIPKFDKVVTLNTANNGVSQRFYNFWFKVKSNILYDSSTATEPYMPYVIALSSNDAVVPSPQVSGTIRAYFKDM